MAAPYILAHRLTDAHRFAQEELEIPRGYYRVVTSPGSIRGPIGADLYLVPGWERRFDRFSMKTAMKFTRLRIIDVEQWRLEQSGGAEEPTGPSERDLEVAYRYNALRDLDTQEPDGLEPEGFTPYLEPEGWEPPETLNAEQILRLAAGESGAEVAPMEERPAEEPKRTRRRRCPDCGTLVEPDALEAHRAEHLPSEEV